MNYKANMIIDLKKLTENVKILQDTYGDYDYIFANVKNDAHGLGFNIVETLAQLPINYLFVSSLEEALAIRQLNRKIKILVNFEFNIDYIYDAIINNITITISKLETLKEICKLQLKDKLYIHLLIDNGNNKIGLKNKAELKTAWDLINSNNKLCLEGIYTDFTTYGIIDENFYLAYQNFLNLIKDFKNQELIIHINEPGMYHRKSKFINGLRFDLSLLGIEENIKEDIINKIKIKNITKKYHNLMFPNINLQLVFKIEAEIIAINQAYKNTMVGKNYFVKNDLNLAVVSIGYKDGITKALEYVLIANKKCFIVDDEIDYLLVECPNTAQIGDKVSIINENTNIYEVINLLKTNRSYLMCVFNKSLNKTYLNAVSNENLL